MRVYSTHTKKKAFCISKMSSGPFAEGEVSKTFAFDDTQLSLSIVLDVIQILNLTTFLKIMNSVRISQVSLQ